MSQAAPRSLVEKLNHTCRLSLEAAAGFCLARTHYNVEVEHWLLKLLETPDTDVSALLRYFEVDRERLAADLTRSLDRLKKGNARPPSLSPDVLSWMQEAWLAASLQYGVGQIRSSHLLYALLSNSALARLARSASSELESISTDALAADMTAVIGETSEANEAPAPTASGEGAAAAAPGDGTALGQYTIDLTARAKNGEIDPVLGRDEEIRQIIDVLTRRRQNNPILTGEAGVGKTAVVEGFALRIAAGDVPPALRDISVRSLDLGLLQAGASVKGEFENRLRGVIDGVKASAKPIVLFIDEAHTLVGAGGQAGQGDAANLLKPALARGELRTIAATTWAEYKKYFEQDAALVRRFQVVKIEEPSEDVAVEMLHGLARTLEAHHNVRVLEEGIRSAVRLSSRYITGRQLPDKAVSLLDTACARVSISHSATPAALEDSRRRIDYLNGTREALQRELATGGGHAEELATLATELVEEEARLAELEERWQKEMSLGTEVRRIRQLLEASEPADGEKPLTEDERVELRATLKEHTDNLHEIQGGEPLTAVCVDSQAVAEVVSNWTGIPVGRMVTDEIRSVLSLREQMEERIVGQSHALDALSQSISTARADLTDPRRPIGVFLLAGPSGVGKTETAITLADLLYGGQQNMTVINMSEFKEEHKTSLLMGSPPGYVGFREGGVLTEAVRRKPYSVVLLDELEKAHEGVQEIFYQVFDKGTLRDGEGRDIDFRNTIILMTSNAGTDLVTKLCADPETRPEPGKLAEALHTELLKTFKPAFLGRVTLVPYFPLADDVLRRIVCLQLDRIGNRITENHGATFSYDDELVAHVAGRCTEVSSGARNVDHILSRTLLPQLSRRFLTALAEELPVRGVRVGIDENGEFSYELDHGDAATAS